MSAHLHRRWPRWVILAGSAAVLLLALGWYTFQWAVEPDDPSSFYRLDAGTAIGAPGTIIRTQALADTKQGAPVQRILYASTDPAGTPIAVSGVVVTPAGSPPADRPWPIVAWAHGTTGVASRCAPSLEGDGGVEKVPGLDKLVADGHVVVITDYPGLGTPGPHPYLVGDSEGRAVLDSIRAAQALVEPGPAAPSAIFGHSQGGHATLFAAQLAPSYAPELRIVGVAPMAPPTDLGGLFQDDIHETAGVALTALAVRSWSSYYPDASEDAVVHADVRGIVQKVGERCIITTEQGIADVPDIAILRTRFLSTDPVTQAGWAPHFTTNSLGATTLTVPALVAQGLKDTIVRPETTTAYVGRQCQAGASVTYDTYVDDDHFSVRTTSAPTVVEWLEARLAGTPAAKGCTTTAIPKAAG